MLRQGDYLYGWGSRRDEIACLVRRDGELLLLRETSAGVSAANSAYEDGKREFAQAALTALGYEFTQTFDQVHDPLETLQNIRLEARS